MDATPVIEGAVLASRRRRAPIRLARRRMAGTFLLEALVAIVVFAVGTLGLLELSLSLGPRSVGHGTLPSESTRTLPSVRQTLDQLPSTGPSNPGRPKPHGGRFELDRSGRPLAP